VTRDLLGFLADTAQSWRAIPQACSCTWKPDYATLPATWRLARANPACKVHENSSDEKNGDGK
jgi:hypothetical protein